MEENNNFVTVTFSDGSHYTGIIKMIDGRITKYGRTETITITVERTIGKDASKMILWDGDE